MQNQLFLILKVWVYASSCIHSFVSANWKAVSSKFVIPDFSMLLFYNFIIIHVMINGKLINSLKHTLLFQNYNLGLTSEHTHETFSVNVILGRCYVNFLNLTTVL
jgi:hypothetical protein